MNTGKKLAGGSAVKMTQREHFDVIIIGSGAGGGTMAYKLAPSGKRISILERGDFLPREKDNWNPHEVFVASKYSNAEMWEDKEGKEFQPGQHYFVGGNTKFYVAGFDSDAPRGLWRVAASQWRLPGMAPQLRRF